MAGMNISIVAFACLVFSLASRPVPCAAQAAGGTGAPLPALPGASPYSPDSALSARDFASRAASKRFSEDWYGAVEDYLAALGRNPAFAEALMGLAECYYELDEYEEALVYAKKAAPFKRGDPALRNLEGFIRIGLADLPGARTLFLAVTAERPNDLDARFGLSLLDLAEGRKTEARARLEDSLRLSPQNARALLSLALISADQGRKEDAASLIERALRFHGQEPRVQYTAARLALDAGHLQDAIAYARNAISMSPAYAEARRLLGALLYRSGSLSEAIALMQEGVARNRKDAAAWFTLGLVQSAEGKTADALYSYRQAVVLREDDEVARLALEDLVMDTTQVESTSRSAYAAWHFDRGREFEDRSYFDKAVVEYRRGLEIDPNSGPGRRLYAELLRKRGLPGRQLGQLKFLKEIGKADVAVNDAIETWQSLLQDSVSATWKVDQYALEKRPYRIALFFPSGGEEGSHAGGREIIMRYLKDILLASSRLEVLDLNPEVVSASEAFRRAREAEADYYLLLGIHENARDIQLGGDLRVARTGSLAMTLSSYRTGNDRIKEASVRLSSVLENSLAPRGSLLKRRDSRGLIDLGSQDGLKKGDKLIVIRKASLDVAPDGLGPSFPKDAVVAEYTVTLLDEEISEGSLVSAGFFDTINAGDEVVLLPAEATKTAAKTGSTASPTAPAGGAGTASSQGSQTTPLFTSVRALR